MDTLLKVPELHLEIHEILKRLSHSGIGLLRACPRKYELSKMFERGEDSEDLVFGKAVGYGIQQLLIGRSKKKVYFEIFRAWKRDIVDIDSSEERKKKSLWHAFHAIDIFVRRHLDNLLSEYDVAVFNGKHALELGFRIKIGSGFNYRGFVDVVLIHKVTGKLLVLEIKTTAYKYVLAASFQNSDQALGYSLICDYIAQQSKTELGSDYSVWYFVYMSTRMEYERLPFVKSHSMRAQWIQDLLLEVEKVGLYVKNNRFPMHGSNCSSYNRPCEFLNVCNMPNSMIMLGANPKVKAETDADFDFNISLEDLIEAQLQINAQEIERMQHAKT